MFSKTLHNLTQTWKVPFLANNIFATSNEKIC